jgi:diacylglycerol kinase family enzyme
MIARAVSPSAKIGYVAHLRRGEHHERDDVLYLRGREVSVRGEAFWVSADGEIYGPERSRTWRLEPAAYAMVLPRP